MDSIGDQLLKLINVSRPTMSSNRAILVTGALGQIGAELVPELRRRFGSERVIASDLRMGRQGDRHPDPPFEVVDCTSLRQIQEVVRQYNIGAIYHLASLLSAVAEDTPRIAWEVNLGGLYKILEVARQNNCSVFFPSSIGAFGPTTPRQQTPQDTIERPTTMYGVTKVAGELLCDYYHLRFGLDTRGVRFPGLISHTAPPGGGTTDYSVDIFHEAVKHGHYTCFLRSDTRLDMMYMPDAIDGVIELMKADATLLNHRNAFNVTAMNFTPAELATEIRHHLPDFTIDYAVDPVRQAIADSWPESIDDSAAREEWGWSPQYGLEKMSKDMLEKMQAKLDIVRSDTESS